MSSIRSVRFIEVQTVDSMQTWFEMLCDDRVRAKVADISSNIQAYSQPVSLPVPVDYDAFLAVLLPIVDPASHLAQ